MTTPSGIADPRIERTREVVLGAAAELVGECGFGNTTIEAIAERSGVARSTIYRHWTRRPDLLIEAIESCLGEIPAPNTNDLREDLVVMFVALGGWLSDPQLGPMAASLLAEASRDPRLASLQAQMTKARRRHIEEVIDRAIEREEIPPTVDSVQLAQDLAAPIFYRAFVTHEPVDEAFVSDHIDRWLDIHLGRWRSSTRTRQRAGYPVRNLSDR